LTSAVIRIGESLSLPVVAEGVENEEQRRFLIEQGCAAGELGGVLGEAIVALLGLALGALGISGIWLWWRRRPVRRVANRGADRQAR
jgi:uncharacterized iron-regulated membrane protein